jgi:hypothetical protein
VITGRLNQKLKWGGSQPHTATCDANYLLFFKKEIRKEIFPFAEVLFLVGPAICIYCTHSQYPLSMKFPPLRMSLVIQYVLFSVTSVPIQYHLQPSM